MANLTTCKSCGREVSKSAKVCPHCGAKLKMGGFAKFMLVLVVLGVTAVFLRPTKEQQAVKSSQTADELAKAAPSNLSPQGELAAAFSISSQHTDVQRDNLKKSVDGKIVQWTLPVFEVKKTENGYTIQTSSGSNMVGTLAYVYPRSDEERTYIESLKGGSITNSLSGNPVTIKGKIAGTFMRNIKLEPAIVIR